MRMLVVGAGAIGGYYGGRLLQARQDVTFLVHSRRAAQLAATGLEICSPNGDAAIPHPPTLLAEDLRKDDFHSGFDLILLSCKAYDLEGAIADLAPAVGSQTLILPLLNGMRHLDLLDQRFGSAHVLGGLCIISTSLDPEGRVVHFNTLDKFVFGERLADEAAPGNLAPAIAALLSRASFQSRLSPCILQEMWEKWVFIAACAAITCLMRASIGDIVAANTAPLALSLLDECAAIASAAGYPPRPEPFQQSRAMLSKAASPLVASMFRDVERRAPVEVEHMIGDLLRRGETLSVPSPLLRLAYLHLKTYEARRTREASMEAK